MIKALSSSLSLRFLSIFVITAIVLIAILVASFSRGMSGQWRRTIQPHLVQYVQYVQQDLGSPPQQAKADTLSRRLLVDIYVYQQDQLIFATNGRALALDEIDFYPVNRRLGLNKDDFAQSNNIRASITREGSPYERILRIDQGDYSVFYDLQKHFSTERRHSFIRSELFHALLGFSLVFLASYFIIRRMLRPIQEIQSGVSRMSNAELDHRINRTGNSDLDTLAQSIDGMAERLKALLDAKRQLLMALSHELRSPITRARISSELLPESKNRDRLLDDLENMERIINDIMESEKLQNSHSALNKESVNVEILLNEELKRLYPDTKLQINGLANAAPLLADAARLKIVFRNILQNALQHGSSESQMPLNIELNYLSNGIEVIVRDYGKGIEAEHLKSITDPFYRPDSSRSRDTGGFGMGLTLAKLIVDAHSGNLTLTSKPDIQQGTRVGLFIPWNA